MKVRILEESRHASPWGGMARASVRARKGEVRSEERSEGGVLDKKNLLKEARTKKRGGYIKKRSAEIDENENQETGDFYVSRKKKRKRERQKREAQGRVESQKLGDLVPNGGKTNASIRGKKDEKSRISGKT